MVSSQTCKTQRWIIICNTKTERARTCAPIVRVGAERERACCVLQSIASPSPSLPCLLASLPASLLACFPACLLSCSLACLLAFLPSLLACLLAYALFHPHVRVGEEVVVRLEVGAPVVVVDAFLSVVVALGERRKKIKTTFENKSDQGKKIGRIGVAKSNGHEIAAPGS